MQARQRGFSLIELIMTVAIAGILAAIALPAYSAYMIRARVSEGLAATSPCRIAVTEIYQSGTSNAGFQADGWGCSEGALRPSQFVHVVHTDADGAIIVTLNPTDARLGGAAGQDIVLTPAGGNLNGLFAATAVTGWVCTPGPTMPPEFLPGTCRQ